MKLTLEALATIKLQSGSHSNKAEGMCLLEATALFSGEKFSDHPACVDPVLASFGRSWNDGLRSDEEREQLKLYIPQLVGTRGSDELSQKRGWLAMDWLVRVHVSAWLSLTPALVSHADALKALPPLTCEADLGRAMPALEKARTASREARAAAWDAAGDAAWAAAGAAAGDAAWAAAGAAAWDALKPTVEVLQKSAHELFARMIGTKE